MRPLELALVAASFLSLAVLVAPKLRTHRQLGHLPIIAAATTFAQVTVEGMRWQMVPAYFLNVVLLCVWLWRFHRVSGKQLPEPLPERRRRPPRLLTYLAFGAGMAMLAASVTAATAFPVFRFPEPSGPYKIGTTTYHWVDEERREIFSADPAAKRELMAQVWYPAEPGVTARHAPYASNARALSEGLTSNLSASGAMPLPSFMFDYFRYVETHAVPDAVVAENGGGTTGGNGAGFPVLIYLTGFSGWSSTNMLQVQELVSHGYVVVGLDQPYTAASVVFPDGRVVHALDRTRERQLVDQSIVPMDPAPEFNGLILEDGIIPYLAEDVSFTLEELAEVNAGVVDADSGGATGEHGASASDNGILAGKLDLGSVGVFGTSLGAMVGAQACHNDPRLEACLMMDAAMPVAVAESGLRQAVMWLTREADLMRLEREKSGGWNEDEIRVTQETMRATFEKSGTSRSWEERSDGHGTDGLDDGNTEDLDNKNADSFAGGLGTENTGGLGNENTGGLGNENAGGLGTENTGGSGNDNTMPNRYFVELPGAFHVDFTDAPLWTPMAAKLGLSGPQGAQTPDIINAYMMAFFDEALRGEPSPLLDGSSQPYPGVTIHSESMTSP